MGQPISACDLLGFGLWFSSCLVFFHSSPTLLGATGAHLLLMTVGCSAPRNFIGYSMDDCKFFSVLLRCGFVHPPVPRYTSHPFPSPSSTLNAHYVPSPHRPIMSSCSSKPSETSHMLSKKRKEQRMALKQFALLSMVTCVVENFVLEYLVHFSPGFVPCVLLAVFSFVALCSIYLSVLSVEPSSVQRGRIRRSQSSYVKVFFPFLSLFYV